MEEEEEVKEVREISEKDSDSNELISGVQGRIGSSQRVINGIGTEIGNTIVGH